MPDDSSRPYVWMLAGSFCFACMGSLANAARDFYPWQLVAMSRSLVPVVIVAGWAIFAGVNVFIYKPGVLWQRSIAGSVSLVATFFALSKLPASEVFTVTNTFPLWIALLSWPMLGERPSLSTWISILCGLAGVFVIYPPTFLAHSPTVEEWPVLVALLASVATAFAMLGLNQLKNLDTRAVVVHFSFTALVFATASYFVFDAPPATETPDLKSAAMLLGAGVSATVGQMFLTKAFTLGRAAKVAVVNLAAIPFSILLQLALFVDFTIDARKIFGMTLVLAPTAWLMARQPFKRAAPLSGEPEATAADDPRNCESTSSRSPAAPR